MNSGQPTSQPTPVVQAKAAAAAVGNAVAAPVKTTLKGFDRAWHFMDGTIRGALDGCAKFGRMGLWVGVAAGVASMLIPGGVMVSGFLFSGLALPFYGAIGGAVAGAAVGFAKGALTGGIERVELENRKEKYSKELEERRSARSTAPARRMSNRAYDRALDYNDRVVFDKVHQYDVRTNQQNHGSWAERVDASRDDSHLSR